MYKDLVNLIPKSYAPKKKGEEMNRSTYSTMRYTEPCYLPRGLISILIISCLMLSNFSFCNVVLIFHAAIVLNFILSTDAGQSGVTCGMRQSLRTRLACLSSDHPFTLFTLFLELCFVVIDFAKISIMGCNCLRQEQCSY